MKPYKLFGNALAAFLDFSAGAFIVYLASLALDYRAGVSSYVIGGVLGISPDIDVLYMFFKKRQVYCDHHQFITHRPVFGIALSSAFGFLLGNNFWAIAAPLCIVWHYLHDTEDLGGSGMAWFWPFSKLYYSSFRVISLEKYLMAENQNKKYEEWLKITWLAPSKTSVIEIVVGSILLGIVSVYIFNWEIGFSLIVAVWLSVIFLWLTFR